MIINDHFQNFKVYQIQSEKLFGSSISKEIKEIGYAKTEINKTYPTLF